MAFRVIQEIVLLTGTPFVPAAEKESPHPLAPRKMLRSERRDIHRSFRRGIRRQRPRCSLARLPRFELARSLYLDARLNISVQVASNGWTMRLPSQYRVPLVHVVERHREEMLRGAFPRWHGASADGKAREIVGGRKRRAK